MKRIFPLCLILAALGCACLHGVAQMAVVPSFTTVAGSGTACVPSVAPCGDDGAATSANMYPFGIALDPAGNLFIVDSIYIRKVDASGRITTIVGTGPACSSPTAPCGDGGPGTSASLSSAGRVVTDRAGNVYIADTGRVRKWTAATGIVTTIAGNGVICQFGVSSCGDGGSAANANLNPSGLAFDQAGNLYISDVVNLRVRRVNAIDGTISTVAGDGTRCSSQTGACGDGGPATSANFYNPNGISADTAGNLYIADSGINRIRKIDVSGTITTVAGNGTSCQPSGATCGDGGAAISANLYYPLNTAVDDAGNLYIADELSNRVRRVSAGTGIITTVAGTGGACAPSGCSEGGVATDARVSEPTSVAFDVLGNLYIAAYSSLRVIKVPSVNLAPGGGIIFPSTAVKASAAVQNILIKTTAAETINSISVPVSQGGQQEYSIGTITGCTLGANNSAGTICTVPITFTPAYPGMRLVPLQVTTNNGNISFGLAGRGIGAQVAMSPGLVTTVAGTGTPGYTGDNGLATTAELNYPFGVALDNAGNIYISHAYYDNVIRKVDAVSGVITTVAGNGTQGSSGDNGPATNAAMGYPEGLAFDAAGNLYIADSLNSRIRKVTSATGIITTVAGNGTNTYSGDNGLAINAGLSTQHFAVDTAGNLYICDSSNSRIREVAASTGIIRTIAGTGVFGFSGDNGSATAAQISPSGISLDPAGNIYFTDPSHNRVRKVTVSTGTITTVAGDGTQGFAGDNGPATSAQLYDPEGITTDNAGNLYILENEGDRLRKVTASTGMITTLMGDGTFGRTGDNGLATSAKLALPTSLALDAMGNIYIVDMYNQRVRKIDVTSSPVSFASTSVGSTSADSPKAVTLSNIGNATFNAPAAGSGTNASISSNFNFGNATTCPANSASGTIGIGVDCIYSINFKPSAPGTLFGSVTLTDDSSTSRQIIALSGSGTGSTPSAPTISFAVPGHTFGDKPFTVTATSNSSGTMTYSVLSGPATLTGTSVTLTGAGTVVLQANQAASGSYASGSQSATFTVNKSVPVLGLTASPNPVLLQNGVSLIATTTSTVGSPTGSVTFFDGNTLIGTAIQSGGIATLTVSTFAVGTHSINAVYSGDTNFTSATSTNVSETVQDLTLSTPSGSSQTIQRGGTATFSLPIAPAGGSTFPAAVAFSASGLPTGATAVFSPSSLAAGSGATTVTLTVQVPQTAMLELNKRSSGGLTLVAIAMLLPLVGGMTRKTKHLRRLLSIALVMVGLGSLAMFTGCGAAVVASDTTNNAQPKTYTIVVTATSGTLSRTSTVTLNVQS